MTEIARDSFMHKAVAGSLFVVLGMGGCSDSPSADTPVDAAAATTPATQSDADSAETAAPLTAASPQAGAPQLTFEHAVHELGTMSDTEVRQFTFDFTNTGDATLSITSVRPACPCATVTMSRFQYAPGESGSINVTFDPTNIGPQNQKIRVFSNVSPEPYEVIISGNVEPFISIQPNGVILGEVALGQEHSNMLFITSPDPDFELVSVQADDPLIKTRRVDTEREVVAAPKGVHVVEVTLPADAPWGGHYTSIHITGRGRPRPDLPETTRTSTVQFAAKLFGNMYGSPDTFRVGAAPGAPFATRVTIGSIDDQPFELLGATPSAPLVPDAEITVLPAGPTGYELNITGTAPIQRGEMKASVIVRTTLPGHEVLEIPLVVLVR